VAGLLIAGATGSIESGLLAYAVLLSAHFALGGLAFLPVLAVTRSRPLGVSVTIAAVLFGLRFGGEWVSLPAAPATGPVLHVETWNLDYFERVGADAVSFLRAHPADVIAVEELTPQVSDAIAADSELATLYPHQELEPQQGSTGIGLLSRFPIENPQPALFPTRLEAAIDTGNGRIAVLAAHPFPARFGRLGLPSYEPSQRNRDVQFLRDEVSRLSADGTPVLFIGDFNTAPTEAAFARLTVGLHDAHAEVGEGPGWTWRPEPLDFLGTGLLRIDLILSSDALRPISTSIECPPTGDHCLFEARLALERS
jgi:endonuclease/exonuclease/phosphatase (EEP) superfamily protein YafD